MTGRAWALASLAIILTLAVMAVGCGLPVEPGPASTTCPASGWFQNDAGVAWLALGADFPGPDVGWCQCLRDCLVQPAQASRPSLGFMAKE